MAFKLFDQDVSQSVEGGSRRVSPSQYYNRLDLTSAGSSTEIYAELLIYFQRGTDDSPYNKLITYDYK